MKTWITQEFNTKLPLIVAPMFLVSNEKMIEASHAAGVLSCYPALNAKTVTDFKKIYHSMMKNCSQTLGINLIVNKSNPYLNEQIAILKELPPAFVITSLGNPEQVVKAFKQNHSKTKVMCDVTDLPFAKKVQDIGADALIAVNSGAGGHAGNLPMSVLVPMLKKNCHLPVISAGGVGSGAGIVSAICLGADGVSVGTPFIASKECSVSRGYKDAIINYDASDIVLTDKISGTNCTVINTPYVKKIGTKQNTLERFLNSHRSIKKYTKMLTFYKGMKALEKAAFSATYKSVWCAGPSLSFVEEEKSIQEIVTTLEQEYKQTIKTISQLEG